MAWGFRSRIYFKGLMLVPLKLNFREGSLQSRVFKVLKDQRWHCRKCEYPGIPIEQFAGGGGIQGLQRGTRSRVGLVIESANRSCTKCGSTRHDRWTGETRAANAASGIAPKLAARILAHFDYVDVIEERKRPAHELVIDHKLPMERWGSTEEPNESDMSEEEIGQKFQLLKKDAAGNHNLLKSRACERCVANGQRGTPFGINYFYVGDDKWPKGVLERGPSAESGCVGCGWYDFDKWRTGLNGLLEKKR